MLDAMHYEIPKRLETVLTTHHDVRLQKNCISMIFQASEIAFWDEEHRYLKNITTQHDMNHHDQST